MAGNGPEMSEKTQSVDPEKKKRLSDLTFAGLSGFRASEDPAKITKTEPGIGIATGENNTFAEMTADVLTGPGKKPAQTVKA